ncbi:MAG: hypothetical protein Q9167_005207 [Letrouitia subvulpina]
METLPDRLASFSVAHPATKKRTSSAKGNKVLKWPHQDPSPSELANAGFFFYPKASAPDNTQCFLCRENLDNWEEGDNAISEHLKLAPHCAWAIIAAIEQDVEDGALDQEDPMSEKLLNARKMTFGAKWPHESKRGWICKTQKVMFEDDIDIKSGRERKSRVSKASRVSTQSNLTVLTEDIAGMEIDSIDVKSIAPPENEPMDALKPTRGAKKGTKNKKATNRTKGKRAKDKVEEPAQASSLVEPEDDDFEIKVEQPPTKPSTGRKRTSDEMNIDNDQKSLGENFKIEIEAEQPSVKRKATKGRGSTVKKAPISTLEYNLDDHGNLTDAEMMPPPPFPDLKKGAKGNKKRTLSTVRKASNTSTASKASLRAAIPTDNEIDAIIEADLNKPLTDEEGEFETVEEPKPKSRRLTRTKPGSRNVSEPIGAARRTMRASTSDDRPTNVNGVKHVTQDTTLDMQEESPVVDIALKAIDHAKEEIMSETRKPKPTRGRSGSKVKVKKQNTQPSKREEVEMSQEAAIDSIADDDRPSKQPKQAKNRQTSHQLPSQNIRESIAPMTTGFDTQCMLNSSVIGSAATGDDSGHETDVSITSQDPPRHGRKPLAPSKKGKSGRKAPTKGRKPKEAAAHKNRQTETERQQSLEEPVLDEQMQRKQIDPAQNSTFEQPTDRPTKSEKARSSTKAEPLAVEIILRTQPQASEVVPVAELPTPGPSADSIATYETPERQSTTPQPKLPSEQQTPKAVVTSLQSSDAENQPPSSRPSALRPPLSFLSPSKTQAAQKVPLAASTPTGSPSKRNISRLQTSLPWTAVEIEKIFAASPAAGGEDKENMFGMKGKGLSSPEKMMSVEEWIKWNAQKGEERLREECERLVGKFECEGVRALKCLEGIICAD